MADLTFTGSTSGNFQTNTNWIVTSTGSTSGSSPANGDTLRFNDLATVAVKNGLTNTLTPLVLIVTTGMRFEIGTAAAALTTTSATLTYAGLGQFGKFGIATLATYRGENGTCILPSGTIGATLFEQSNGRTEIGSAELCDDSGWWNLRAGTLELLATSTAGEPDFFVGKDAALITEQDLGNVWNSGRVILRKKAEIEAAHIFYNMMGGFLDHRSNGAIPILNTLPGSRYTMQNAERIGSLTVLNEWDGSDVVLRGPGGDIVPGTHNFIGKPALGASGAGAGIAPGGRR